jgi:hypothetical protein
MPLSQELLNMVAGAKARYAEPEARGVGVSKSIFPVNNSDAIWYRADLIMRAFTAYSRQTRWTYEREAPKGEWPTPDGSFVYVDISKEQPYVVLGAEHCRPIAVYRVDRRGKLVRLKRFPASATETADLWDFI